MSFVTGSNTAWTPQMPAPASQSDNGPIGAGHPATAPVQPTSTTRVTVKTTSSVAGEGNKNAKNG